MSVYKVFETDVSRSQLEQNLEQADYEENIHRLSEFLESNATNSHAFNNRGIAFYNAGQREAALQDFDRAADCDPKNIKPHYLKAQMFKESGDYKKVVESYTRAIESAVVKGHIYDIWAALRERAAAYFEMNLPHKAIEDLDEAIKIAPTLDTAYFDRGKVLYRIGEREKAFEDLKNASIWGESFDWFAVLDIILAEPELQKSGFIHLFLTVRELIAAAGMPVDGNQLSREEIDSAGKENRLLVIDAFKSMGDTQICFTPPTEENMRYFNCGLLIFPKSIPPELLCTHWTKYETAEELFALFRKFEKRLDGGAANEKSLTEN